MRRSLRPRYWSRRKSRIVFAKKSTAITTVSRVRLRSTMCVPPWDAGVNPMPPMPASRPECISTSPTSAAESSTWIDGEERQHRAPNCSGRSTVVAVDEAEARQKIHDLLLTGDNRLKQGVSRSKRCARATSRRSPSRREHGLEDGVRPLVEIRLADLEQLARESPRSARAWRLTSCSAAASRAASFGRGSDAAVSSARASAGTSSGSTRTPAAAVTNSGGPPNRVATTVRPARHRLEQRLPERLEQRRAADDVGRGEPRRHRVVGHAADDPDALAARRAAARSGPSPTKVSEPRPSLANASARRTTFLRSVRRADVRRTQETRARRRGSAVAKRSRSTPESTTSVFPRASGRRSLELALADSRRRTTTVAARGGRPARVSARDARHRRRCCGRRGRAR